MDVRLGAIQAVLAARPLTRLSLTLGAGQIAASTTCAQHETQVVGILRRPRAAVALFPLVKHFLTCSHPAGGLGSTGARSDATSPNAGWWAAQVVGPCRSIWSNVAPHRICCRVASGAFPTATRSLRYVAGRASLPCDGDFVCFGQPPQPASQLLYRLMQTPTSVAQLGSLGLQSGGLYRWSHAIHVPAIATSFVTGYPRRPASVADVWHVPSWILTGRSISVIVQLERPLDDW
jgi:hypothetical protein